MISSMFTSKTSAFMAWPITRTRRGTQPSGVRRLAAALGWAGYGGEMYSLGLTHPRHPPQSGGKPPHSKAAAAPPQFGSRHQAGVDAARARHFAGKGLNRQLRLLQREVVGVHALERHATRFDQADGRFVGAPGHAEGTFDRDLLHHDEVA